MSAKIGSIRFRGLLPAGLFVFAFRIAGATQFQIADAVEFNNIINTNTAVLTTNATLSLSGGSLVLEGPTWIPGSPGYLIFSYFNNSNPGDSNGRLKKLVLPGTVTDYLVPPADTVYNGSTLDMQERFISCQAGSAGLCVAMITNNSVVTKLVTTCNGLKFYSPNDDVVKSDGTIWFTDPGFNSGITFGTSGYATEHNVYRFNPTNGNTTCAAVLTFPGTGSSSEPNGLCFSPDESLLYLADWGNRRILVYSVSPSNTLSGGAVFMTLPTGKGNPDGIRCDAAGRVYSSASDGVYIYRPYPDGRLIGQIVTPTGVNNLCFGGDDRCTLFIASAPYILSIPLKVTGAVWIGNWPLATMEAVSWCRGRRHPRDSTCRHQTSWASRQPGQMLPNCHKSQTA